MSYFDFFGGGTATEQKRDKYKKLYNKLKNYSLEFDKEAKLMSEKIESYIGNRPDMNSAYIPEDIFSESETNVRTKIISMQHRQLNDGSKLLEAVSVAYDRYSYYKRLAIQEAEERAARARREAERRKKELSGKAGRW